MLKVMLLWAFLGSCGIQPIPPVPPVGCRAMIPVCVCDADGECHWIFECVRD